jgi:hypothetical protein
MNRNQYSATSSSVNGPSQYTPSQYAPPQRVPSQRAPSQYAPSQQFNQPRRPDAPFVGNYNELIKEPSTGVPTWAKIIILLLIGLIILLLVTIFTKWNCPEQDEEDLE